MTVPDLDREAMAAVQSIYETTASLKSALQTRYPPPEWLTATEVACGERRLDVVAVRMWTRAYVLAFEVKATRADWLREMRDPRKADACVGIVDEFWLVTAPNVAKLEEIPEHWGWICQQANGKLRQVKKAPQLLASKKDAMERVFWASMISRAWRSNEDQAERTAAVDDAYRRGMAEANRQAERNAATAASTKNSQLEELRRIREALGRDITGPAPTYEIVKHAETIKAVIAGERAMVDLRNLRDQAERIVGRLERALNGEGTRVVLDASGTFREVSG